MPKIKLAYIITSLELGGAQKTTLSLILNLNNEHYEVHLITSPEGYLVEKARQIPGLKICFINSLIRRVNIAKDLTAFFYMLKYLKQNDISIVHTHSSKAGIIGRWAAWFSGVRRIFHTVHGWPFYIESSPPARLFYIIAEKLTSCVTSRLIVVSNADLRVGLRYINKRKEKYAKIPYGIETRKFLTKNHRIVKENIIRIGFMACYKPQKAPFDFIKVAASALKKNKDIEFISAGDGILRPAVMKEVSRLGLNGKIKFLGWQDDIAGLMSKIDILLLTSRWEGLPVVILEALAAGIPVVATNAGGIPELIVSGINGFIEEKGDYQKLADDILTIAEDDNKRFQFSVQARKSFGEEFDISYMNKRVQSLYKRIEGEYML
jgi:glycosyltransferase involved in cell wall biosynthesis